jgi:hypothetical protein
MDKLWQQTLLNIGGQPLLDILTEMHGMQVQHGKAIDDIQRNVAILATGFPDGDIEGHRRYHESVIKWHELRNQVLRAALEKVVQAGALAGFGYLAVLLWEWFKLEVKK